MEKNKTKFVELDSIEDLLEYVLVQGASVILHRKGTDIYYIHADFVDTSGIVFARAKLKGKYIGLVEEKIKVSEKPAGELIPIIEVKEDDFWRIYDKEAD